MSVRPTSWLAIATACGALALCGCSHFMHEASGGEKAEERKAEQEDLQLATMRLADVYVGRVLNASYQMQAAGAAQRGRLRLQGWVAQQVNAAYTSATGSRPVVNLLDLLVLATLSRRYSERWNDDTFGVDPAPLVEAQRDLERQVSTFAGRVVPAAALAEVHETIDAWQAKHPDVVTVGLIRFIEFASEAGRPVDASGSSPNLFSLFGLDPLQNIDPAVRQLELTRQFAERAIYVAQRVPYLVDAQLRFSALGIAAMPEVQQALDDVSRASHAADTAATTVAQLPDVLARERAAVLDSLWGGLDRNEARARALVTEVRATLGAADQTARSLQDAAATIDELLRRLDRDRGRDAAAGGTAAASPGRPFDVREYTAAAEQLGRAARDLEALVARTAESAPAAEKALGDASRELHALTREVFWRIVALIATAIVGGLAAALAFVRLAPRARRYA